MTPNKLLWVSNSPAMGTGYGTQTEIFTKLAKADGFDVVIFGMAGHRGSIMKMPDGIEVFPGSFQQYGGDMIQAHRAYHKPDATVLLYDIWVYEAEQLQAVTAWAPIDHDRVPGLVAEKLHYTEVQWAMSRHAETQMKAIGLSPVYVPHGVDTDVFHILPKAEREKERESRKISPDTFVACMVAANKGANPSRKAFPEVLRAWSIFIKDHPDSVLLMHTLITPDWGGVDLAGVAALYGIPPHTLRFTDPFLLLNGMVTDRTLNLLYNSADVHLLPSMGEGFGIPVMEAHSAGCPSIVCDFSAQAELAGPGYKVPTYDDDLWLTGQGAHWARPRVSEIVKGLEWAYENRGDEKLREQSREFAMEYDGRRVWTTYMKPALMAQVEREAERQARTAEREALRNIPTPDTHPHPRPLPKHGEGSKIPECEHVWSKTALVIDGVQHAPCTKPGCGAALKILSHGHGTIVPCMFDMTVDGRPMDIEDDPHGGVAKLAFYELIHSYGLDKMTFKPGDVVLDIGAQVGVVSTYLGMKHPEIRIIAVEPHPQNAERLRRNLEANGVKNVTVIEKAVTGDGRKIVLRGDASQNSGGFSAFGGSGAGVEAESVTLANIFAFYEIDRLALLKIDCEGAEYEILRSAGDVLLSKIGAIRGELHTNQHLIKQGHTPTNFMAWLKKRVDDVQMTVTRMAELVETEEDGDTKDVSPIVESVAHAEPAAD